MHCSPALEPSGLKAKDAYLRWISPRHAYRYELSRAGDGHFATLSHAVVSADKKLAYIKNSKVACTTITSAIYQYDSGVHFRGDVHTSKKLSQGPKYLGRNMKAIENGATAFSFVRNPVARCRSAFINFFIDHSNLEMPKHLDALKARAFYKKDDLHYRFDVFLAYIEESMGISAGRTDRHWRSQIFNTGVDMIPLAHVGRIEDGLEAGLKIVASIAGCRELRLPTRPLNVSSTVDFQPSRSQVDIIRRLYGEDYERFGY